MNEYSAHHTLLSDEALVRIAHFGVGKFKKEARDSAKEELKRRRLPDDQLEHLKKEIKTLNRIERNQKLKNKDEKYGVLDFLLDLIIYW